MRGRDGGADPRTSSFWRGWTWALWLVGAGSLGTEWGPDGGEVAAAICIWSLHTLQPHALIPGMKAGPWELSAPRDP